jgi:hypothetical protein
VFQDLGDGSWRYNFNIREVPANDMQEESGNEETAFEYESVLVWGKPNYVKTVTAVINEYYSKDDEIAIINKGIEDKDNAEYVTYRRWVGNTKEAVKNDMSIFGYET